MNKIIEHDAFNDMLATITAHVFDFNNGYFNANNEGSNAIAKAMNCKPHEVKKYIKTSSENYIQSTLINIVNEIE